jgi:hypothetical protein
MYAFWSNSGEKCPLTEFEEFTFNCMLACEYTIHRTYPWDAASHDDLLFREIVDDYGNYVPAKLKALYPGAAHLINEALPANYGITSRHLSTYAHQFLASINPCGSMAQTKRNAYGFYSYYDEDYDDGERSGRFNIRITRKFVKDLITMGDSYGIRFINHYFYPLSRGQIMDRSYLSNYRKYSEDSYEFYVPVEGGLILTWRLFADVNIQGDSNSKSGLAFVLMYTLSFDAVCNYELEQNHILYEMNPLAEEQSKKVARSSTSFENLDFSRKNVYMGSKNSINACHSLELLLHISKLSHENFMQRGWIDFLQAKPDMTSDHYIEMKPRFNKTTFSFELREYPNITIKRGVPDWVSDRLIYFNSALNSDSVGKKRTVKLSPEEEKEYRDLKNLVDTAYEIYTCESIKYTSFLQKLPKHIQVFYEKVDDDILMNSLQKSKILDDRFSGVQKKVAFTGKNVLFFGRSGTGKTHCCTHALVSRYLTADAIERKMSKKSTDIKNDTNISGLKSIFITASALLAKEVKAQYETTLKRVETINAKEEIRVLTEEKIFDSLQAVQSRGKELPKSFFETDIQWPLFLSHQEFVSILYNTMLEGNTDFKQMEQRVKIDANDDGNITINRR